MADIAASDVTYVISNQKIGPNSRSKNLVKATFGDGTLTYPTGGIPLTKAKMGLPTVIEHFSFDDAANDDGYMYKYDRDAEKIRIYVTGDADATAAATATELAGGSDAVAATTIYFNVEGW